jgi:hypothetical protein
MSLTEIFNFRLFNDFLLTTVPPTHPPASHQQCSKDIDDGWKHTSGEDTETGGSYPKYKDK